MTTHSQILTNIIEIVADQLSPLLDLPLFRRLNKCHCIETR